MHMCVCMEVQAKAGINRLKQNFGSVKIDV